MDIKGLWPELYEKVGAKKRENLPQPVGYIAMARRLTYRLNCFFICWLRRYHQDALESKTSSGKEMHSFPLCMYL